jgi:hypothetical protein
LIGIGCDRAARLPFSARVWNLSVKGLFLRLEVVHLDAVRRTRRGTHHMCRGVDRNAHYGTAERRSNEVIRCVPGPYIVVDKDRLRAVVGGRHVGMVCRRILRDKVRIVHAVPARGVKYLQNLVRRNVGYDDFESGWLGDNSIDDRGGHDCDGIALLIGNVENEEALPGGRVQVSVILFSETGAIT